MSGEFKKDPFRLLEELLRRVSEQIQPHAKSDKEPDPAFNKEHDMLVRDILDVIASKE